MELTLNRFEDLNLYSNKNIEKIMAQLIAESSNAVLVNTYEDGAILLDHQQGQFYLCEYAFDKDKESFTFSNFEPIELVREKNDFFKDSAYNFFESEDTDTQSLLEDYKDSIMKQDSFLDDIVNESMLYKNFDNQINYDVVSELNEHTLDNEEFFKYYKERLQTHPLTSIKYFNWKDPVTVSLNESERFKIINSSAKEKAANLWKDSNFKDKFVASAKTFVENVEDGVDSFADLFAEYPTVFLLDKADKKTLFGKILIGTELREQREDVLKGISLMFEKEEAIKDLQNEYITLMEAGEFEKGESVDFTDDEGNTKPTKKEKEEMLLKKGDKEEDEEEKEEKPKELTDDEVQKLVDELKKLKKGVDEKEDCESLKDKIDSLIDELEKSKKEGTKPDVVKECVELLSL